ncbi:MAG TPA: hypothetical protein VIJ46_02630 [Rhabdochlamydiaceae bacterium]
MVVLDCVRSSPCWNWDPISLLNPEQLRMVFVASAIIAAVAAVFTVYSVGAIAAVPFLCCAGASHLCTYLVERYFIYEQALENHSRVVRDLRATLHTAEQALARSEQHAAERRQQNSALDAQVQRLETAVPALSEDTQRFIAGLQEETGQQRAQNVELRALVQSLTEQNAQHEQTRSGFAESLAAADRMNQALRQANGVMREQLTEQRRVNQESREAVSAYLAQTVHLPDQRLEAAAAVDRIKDAAQDVVSLQQEAQTRGEKLLQLQKRLASTDANFF